MKLSVVFRSAKPSFQFVPKHLPTSVEDVKSVQEFVDRSSKMFIITGAGISTESDIPDYRSEAVGLYSRSTHRPMKIQEFLESPSSRRRYWARNYVGWRKFSSAQPNINHNVLAQWQHDTGRVKCLITQNVDGLHRKAGSNAIELHGTAFVVKCLKCDYKVDRNGFQVELKKINPHFASDLGEVRPDGDVGLSEEDVALFTVPPCPSCSTGILKPDIVFFGDNVKRDKVEMIYSHLQSSDSILVLGSSLQVFSSFRFVLRGQELGLPIATLTIGKTRADGIAQLILNSRLGNILPQIQVR